jgi:CRISPR/Cas system-associated exonuclease Cas4 (RecB family)
MNILCSAGRGEMPAADCLACAVREVTPPCGYDYALLKALLSDEERQLARRARIHVTDLTGCIRRVWYDKVEPSPELVHSKLARWLGTNVHAGAELEDEIAVSEVGLDAGGIVGTADVIYQNGDIVDIKTTRWLKRENLPYGSHGLQVNLYAWMQRKLGRPVGRLFIQYIDLSGPSKCRRCKPSRPVEMIRGELKCPDCLQPVYGAHLGALKFEVPLMSDQEVEDAILERKEELEASIALGDPPTREPGYLCAYCAHLSKCNPGAYD